MNKEKSSATSLSKAWQSVSRRRMIGFTMRMLSSRRRSPHMSVIARHRVPTKSRDGRTALPALMIKIFGIKEAGSMPRLCSKFLHLLLRYLLRLPLLWCLLPDQMSPLRTDSPLFQLGPPVRETSCSRRQQPPPSMACSTSLRALGPRYTAALMPQGRLNAAFV